MMIMQANLLDTQFQLVAHQVNCRGVMGAGIARALNEATHGELLKQYREYIEEQGGEVLGTCFPYYCKGGRYILNLFGQDGFGTSKQQTNYEALRSALIDAWRDVSCELQKPDAQMCIAIPYKMGCGLAGGDWNKVTEILEEIEREYNVLFIAHKI